MFLAEKWKYGNMEFFRSSGGQLRAKYDLKDCQTLLSFRGSPKTNVGGSFKEMLAPENLKKSMFPYFS